jgi:hypothetical protein
MSERSTSASGTVGRNPGPDAPAVFLSYPFRSREDWIRHYVPSILGRWGYAVDEGSHFEGLPISDAVCRAIGKAQVMVAFITKCRKLVKGGWATSDWVLEEIGFARGKDVRAVVIVERGVNVNLGILSDIQRIVLDSHGTLPFANPLAFGSEVCLARCQTFG